MEKVHITTQGHHGLDEKDLFQAALKRFSLQIVYIPGRRINIANDLFRFENDRFRRMRPGANLIPTNIFSDLSELRASILTPVCPQEATASTKLAVDLSICTLQVQPREFTEQELDDSWIFT